jgi:hypothetical protein
MTQSETPAAEAPPAVHPAFAAVLIALAIVVTGLLIAVAPDVPGAVGHALWSAFTTVLTVVCDAPVTALSWLIDAVTG